MEGLTISKILLKKMTLINFKVNKKVEIDFNDTLTEILGDNGTGKTTIRDAFAFAFLGTDATGSSSFDAINNTSKMATVIIDFIDQNNKLRTIKRVQQITPAGSKTNKLYLDGASLSVSKFKKEMNADLFLSIINPDYFLELSAVKAKNLLLDLMNMSYLDILMDDDMLAENSQLIKDDESNLEEICNSELAKERRRKINSEIKELEKEILLSKNIIDKTYISMQELEMLSIGQMDASFIFTEEKLSETLNNSLDNPISGKRNILEFAKMYSKKEYVLNANIRLKQLKEIIEREEKIIQINMLEIEKLENLNKAYKNYIDVELKLINNYLSRYYKDINIQVKDDENDRFVFERFYNNNNVSVSSLSEKIKFGIEFANILITESGLNIPIMIDNAESITTLEKSKFLYNRQLVSFAVTRGVDLSKVENDMIKDLKTEKLKPRKDINESFIYRVFAEDIVQDIID